MSEYMFGLGDGWLPKKANAIAQRYGARLCNHTDPQCKCGHGCQTFNCRASRRHWFAGPNYGAPFDAQMVAAVEADLAKAGLALR